MALSTATAATSQASQMGNGLRSMNSEIVQEISFHTVSQSSNNKQIMNNTNMSNNRYLDLGMNNNNINNNNHKNKNNTISNKHTTTIGLNTNWNNKNNNNKTNKRIIKTNHNNNNNNNNNKITKSSKNNSFQNDMAATEEFRRCLQNWARFPMGQTYNEAVFGCMSR